MPNYTENYNLKKPLPNENYNIQDHNDNMDIIDSELKKLDQKVENIEVPVTSVNGKTGDVELTADDVGAETPAGAQAKADAAAAAAVAAHDTKEKHIAYAVASGTNTYTVSIPGISQLVEGMSIKVKFANGNTGASTMNINGLGAKSIVKGNGGALTSGYIKAGQICHLVYNGSNFQLLGEGGEYGTAQPQHVLEGYTIGTEEGIKTGTMPNRSGKENMPDATWSQPGFIQVRPPKGYYDGVQGTVVKWEDTNFIADNIRAGKSVFGLAGSFTSDATMNAADLLTGKTGYVNGNKVTGTMPNQGAKIITPSTVNQAIPAGYHNGQGYVKGDANLIAANIKKGVSIFGVTGTVEPKQIQMGIEATSPVLINTKFIRANGQETVGLNAVQVTGLTFLPDVILMGKNYGNNTWYTAVICFVNWTFSINGSLGQIFLIEDELYDVIGDPLYHIKLDGNIAYVTSTGFCLPCWARGNHEWIAIKF